MDNNDAIETAYAFPSAKIVAVHNEGWGHFTESHADVPRAFGTQGLASRLLSLEVGRPKQICYELATSECFPAVVVWALPSFDRSGEVIGASLRTSRYRRRSRTNVQTKNKIKGC
jgi:hypothetical protein